MMAGAPLDASGQPNVGAVALQRFFALHVAVLPTLFMPLLGLHLWLVQKHGNAIPPSEQDKPTTKTVPFFPNFLFKDLVVWLNIGMHHLTRAEDLPVMPIVWHSFKLRPFNFHDRNPALDLRTDFAK